MSKRYVKYDDFEGIQIRLGSRDKDYPNMNAAPAEVRLCSPYAVFRREYVIVFDFSLFLCLFLFITAENELLSSRPLRRTGVETLLKSFRTQGLQSTINLGDCYEVSSPPDFVLDRIPDSVYQAFNVTRDTVTTLWKFYALQEGNHRHVSTRYMIERGELPPNLQCRITLLPPVEDELDRLMYSGKINEIRNTVVV